MLRDNLKKARKKRHLTQREVAEKIGVAPITISRYETGDREPDLKTLFKLADVYDVNVNNLIDQGFSDTERQDLKDMGIYVEEAYDPLIYIKSALIENSGYGFFIENDKQYVSRNGKTIEIKNIATLDRYVEDATNYFKYRFLQFIKTENK